MAVPCSCHVIDTQQIINYLLKRGAPVLTEKEARPVRADLHKAAANNRKADGLDPRNLCGSCAEGLAKEILKVSAMLYPSQHADYEDAQRLKEAA